ncbi:MAG: response regulator [Candidatus Solibacter usitatus]|nr:response regulator [Candidatus Solibacter usitatus]
MLQAQDGSLLKEAVAAAKAGEKALAMRLLQQATLLNPGNELAWLWRASLAGTADEAARNLSEVLRINPDNQKAIAWMSKCQAAAAPPSNGSSHAPEVPAAVAAVVEPKVEPKPEPKPLLEPQPHVEPASVTKVVVVAETPKPVRVEPPPPAPARSNNHPAADPVPQSARGWHCPFCSHASEVALRKCVNCNAVTVLEDLSEIARNEGIRDKIVREAIGRMESMGGNRGLETNIHLALGHLNVREASAAIPYLRAAMAQRRGDWNLNNILDQLQFRKVILVADDSQTIRKALSGILERNNYRVMVAEDGKQALARLNEAIPDLVLLDITMPWMDGYEVCKNIRGKAMTKKVPVVMLSGKDGLFDKMRGKFAGCNDYVTKPFDPQILLKTIRKYVPQSA